LFFAFEKSAKTAKISSLKVLFCALIAGNHFAIFGKKVTPTSFHYAPMSRGFFGNFLGFLGFFEKVYEIFSTDLPLAPCCEFTQKGYKRVLKSPKTYTFLEFFWENHLINITTSLLWILSRATRATTTHFNYWPSRAVGL